MGTRSRLAGVVLCSGLHACSVAPYACLDDNQCVRAGQEGVCEVEGYCAYLDLDCVSGWRFSVNAAEDLANQCVPDDDFDSGGSSSSGGSTDSSSSGGGDFVCGDGVVDPGEDCDDANLDEGDGCTPQCRISGSERWVQRYGAMADDRAVAMLVRDDGVVVVAGEQDDAEGDRSALVLAYEPDGALIEPAWVDEEPGDRRVHGLATDGLTVMVTGEQSSTGPAGARAWYAWLDALVEPQQIGAVDTLAYEVGRGAAYTSQGFVLIGIQDGRAWARWVQSDRPDWRGEAVTTVDVVASRGDGAFVIAGSTARAPMQWWLISPQGSPLAEGSADGQSLRAAGFDAAGRPLLGGTRGGQPWLAAFELDGSTAFDVIVDVDVPEGSVEGIAGVVNGDCYAVGTDGGGVQGWAARLDSMGRVRWSDRVLTSQGEVELGAVVHDHRNEVLYVAGTERREAGDLDVLVAALEP